MSSLGPAAIIEIARISGAIKLISKAGRSGRAELNYRVMPEHLTKLFVFCDYAACRPNY